MTSNIFWLACIVAVFWLVRHVLGHRNILFHKYKRATEIVLPTKDLKSTLRGQIIRVPDLTKLFTHWPAPRISSHLNELRLIHDGKVLEWFPDEKVRKKMMGIDVPLFAAMWWPDASIDRHLSVIYYTIWLFVWDDHFDSPDIDPSLPTASGQLSRIHTQAIEYTKYHLGLSKLEYEPMAPSQYSKIFAEAGDFFRSGMTETQRTRFLKQINFYMECSRAHQRYIELAKLPKTRDEYWQMRSGDSAYLTYCALNEYILDIFIPDGLIETEQMRILWFECMRCIIYVNDLVSLKKEMDNSLCSLVPIMMNETGLDLSSVVDLLIEDFKKSIAAVDKVINNLLAQTKDDQKLHENMQKYLHGIKTPLTGNWDWSLSTKRYDIKQYVRRDGTLEIPL